jgi:hypothetical protein
VAYHLALAVTGHRWLALSVAAAVAITPPLPWWALSGMEPPFVALLACLGVLLHLKFRASPSACRRLIPTVVFALAALSRPECFLLFPLAMLDRVVVSRWLTRDEDALRAWVKDLALHVPVFALIVAPFFLYNYRTTGYWLPTSYYSKVQPASLAGAFGSDTVSFMDALVVSPAWILRDLAVVWGSNNVALLSLSLVGIVWIIRRALAADAPHRSFIIPALVLGQPLLWALVGGYRHPGMQGQRYIANLGPLFVLLGVVGGWWITAQVSLLRRPAARAALLAVVLLVSLMRQPSGALTYGLNVKNITEMQVTIGRWLHDHVPAEALLAVNDIGAIGMLTGCTLIDLEGLITPEVIPCSYSGRIGGEYGDACYLEFVLERRPDYLVIFPDWYPELAGRADLFTPVYSRHLKDNITCGKPLMTVYQTAWCRYPQVAGGGGKK